MYYLVYICLFLSLSFGSLAPLPEKPEHRWKSENFAGEIRNHRRKPKSSELAGVCNGNHLITVRAGALTGSLPTMPKLPTDVIISDILTRVPAKTAARSKSVCKEWRALLSTRDFEKAHCSRTLIPSNQKPCCSVTSIAIFSRWIFRLLITACRP
ncbi:putative F-box domain-containing protein [Helianthus annuus]|uniref:F-box domain-containing protein n=1 Tax=Helianthus annuus TaxID=4232 RepID=A0A251SA05_HELAN|nr:putative F-box domain-containing protein [Helianthus annuus]KAJ0456775.1 putative F-box domain-containing protein [Helianthus annuus]KAJ0832210.1 putative F-box domain-containing protein [Helianthus annuus]